MKYYAEKSANSFGLLSFWERELPGISDEAVLLRNVMRKKYYAEKSANSIGPLSFWERVRVRGMSLLVT
ncbi:TPA: hypothetical protein ACSTLS_004601 [Serratia fonticola]